MTDDIWRQSRLLSIGDDDMQRAPLLWSRADAKVVRCGVSSVAVTGASGQLSLDWRPASGPFDPKTCLLLDAKRAWFASPADELTPLRAVWPLLGDDEAQAAVAGVALMAWHATSGFCPVCGRPTVIEDGGWVRVCPGCAHQQFPRIDPAVIVALVDGDDRLLLGAQPTWGRRRSVFAGFVMAGESLEQAVHREVREETGLIIDEVVYFGSQPWPLPRSLMVAFTAHVANPGALHVDGREIVQADWLARDEVRQAWAAGDIDPPPPMSIAHALIMTWLDKS